MNETQLDEFKHLWDGSESWVLSIHHKFLLSIRVRFTCLGPSVKELLALRRLIPELARVHPSQASAQIGKGMEYQIGTFQTAVGEELCQKAKSLGLNVYSQGVSYTGYLPIRSDDRSALIIEDDELADRVSQRMLAAGVPVIDYAADVGSSDSRAAQENRHDRRD